MKNKDKIKKTVELITKKLNPPYQKEIIPIDDKIINLSKEELEELNLSKLAKRGLVELKETKNYIPKNEEDLTALPEIPLLGVVTTIAKIDENTIAVGGADSKVTLIDISNKDSLKALGSTALGDWVRTIAKIDENTIIAGGAGLTLIDISSKENIKQISTFLELEDGVYEIVNNKEIILKNTKREWQYGNDETLYKYARLYDPNSDTLVPYYVLDKRVKIVDKNTLVISREVKTLKEKIDFVIKP